MEMRQCRRRRPSDADRRGGADVERSGSQNAPPRRRVCITALVGRSLVYGELVERAATLPAPDARDGEAQGRCGLQDHRQAHARTSTTAPSSTGKPLFGIDVKVPGMRLRGLREVPGVRRKGASANVEQLRALPGVRHAFVVEGGTNSPVCWAASPSWPTTGGRAHGARQQLRVEWNEGPTAQHSSVGFAATAPTSSRSSRGARRFVRTATSTPRSPPRRRRWRRATRIRSCTTRRWSR